MKGLERLLKIVTSIVAIAAAILAFFYFFQSKKERLDELNDYLMGDDDEESTYDDQTEDTADCSDIEYLQRDMRCLDQLEANQSAQLAFLVDPDYLTAFQNTLADAGYSSEYNPDSQMLEMLLAGPTDHEEISELGELLSELLTSTHSTYLGFALQ